MIAFVIYLVLLLALVAPATAGADLPSLKESCTRTDAADHDTDNAIQIPYRFCDDGLPPVGGTTPNEGGKRAIRVPQRYAGYSGLPRKVRPDPDSGADSKGYVALDVNVALPDPRRFPRPRDGYPLIVLMHGCCSGSKESWHGDIDAPGERWHYSDAWFAARGYVALTYTSRGFVDADGRGSTGVTQIDHRSYEMNDFQYLAGLLADDPFFGINPKRVVATGGSYGGGFAWLALTDPTWRSPRKKIAMKLAAVAPKYGWTDLVNSLVPNGRYRQGVIAPVDPAAAVSRNPLGAPKRSFLLALYTSGTAGLPPPGAHATFPEEIDEAFACFSSTDPYEQNPLCTSTLGSVLDSFVRDRSAYFQTDFLRRIARDPSVRIPIFSAGTFSDQLFTMQEHRRMQALLRSIAPTYPIQEYYGDYNHGVQNKDKEWADLCDADRHVCRAVEYRRGFNNVPVELVRLGVTTRLNRFIDHYAKPPANPRQSRPASHVTVSLQTCRQNDSDFWRLDEPGMRFNAPRIEDLAPHRLTFEFPERQQTTNKASPNTHATQADPVANQVSNDRTCASHSSPAGPGVATYDSERLDGDATMIGQSRVQADVSGVVPNAQLNARLYDLFPDGTQVLVDRGVHTLGDASGSATFDLHGNGWRFPRGHRIRLELAQDDDPYVKSSNTPSTLTLENVRLDVPIREVEPGAPGEAGPTVRLSIARFAGGRMNATVRSATGERYGIARYEVQVGMYRDYQPEYQVLEADPADSPYRTFEGIPAVQYVFAGRAIDVRGVPGPWAYRTVTAR